MDPYRSGDRLQCPRCDVPLVTVAPAETCNGCGGMFLRETRLDRALGPDAPSRMSLWWRTPELRCPTCDAEMRVMLAAEVMLDRCPEHGIWLDAGELAKLMRESHVAATGDDVIEQLRSRLSAQP